MKTRLGLHLAASCLFAASAAAQTLDVVHRFQARRRAYGRLIQAADGNFYGTTSWGGANGVGTIFKMDASGTLTTLHSFGYPRARHPEGRAPPGAPTATSTGRRARAARATLGTVFKMDAAGDVTAAPQLRRPGWRQPLGPAHPDRGRQVLRHDRDRRRLRRLRHGLQDGFGGQRRDAAQLREHRWLPPVRRPPRDRGRQFLRYDPGALGDVRRLGAPSSRWMPPAT